MILINIKVILIYFNFISNLYCKIEIKKNHVILINMATFNDIYNPNRHYLPRGIEFEGHMNPNTFLPT